MREVPAKLVGSFVLVAGAAMALAAGALVPLLAGGAGAAGWGGWRGWGGLAAWVAGGSANAPTADTEGPSETGKSWPTAKTTSPSSEVFRKNLPRPRTQVLQGAVEAAARMPAGADMVMVVDHAADWRGSPFGEAAVRFLIDASGTTPTRQAWATLAEQLGWSESETFDRLLGRRVVLVARGFGNPDAARWALLSDVSVDTDQRLKERLQAAQRSIDQGHQILSIEKGKYELTSHRRAAAPKAHPDDEVTIVLGPSGRSELFDEVVSVLARGADDPLGPRDAITTAAAAGPSEILLLSRLGGSPESEQTGGDRWSDFFMLAGGRVMEAGRPHSGDQFNARVVYRDRSRREANMAISPSSDAVFRALAPKSMFTVVQAAPVQQILGEAARMLDTLRDLPLPWTAQALVGARQVLSVRELTPPKGVTAEPVTRPPLAAMLAIETVSTAEIAPILDGSITRFIAAQEQMRGETKPPPHDFGGVMPGVTRVLPLELPDGHPVRLFIPDALMLTWSYPPNPHHRLPTGESAGPLGSGWWAMSIAPALPGLESLPEVAHNEMAMALSEAAGQGGDPAGDRRWVWLASARPSAIEQRLPSMLLLPDIGGFRSAMRRFDELRVELLINQTGDIQGDLRAKLAPTPSTPKPSEAPATAPTKPGA